MTAIGDIPDLPEFDRRSEAGRRVRMLSLHVSDHPRCAASRRRWLATRTMRSFGFVGSVRWRTTYRQDRGPGLRRDKVTKQGECVGVAAIEDLSGSVDVLFFPRSYESIQTYLAQDIIVR